MTYEFTNNAPKPLEDKEYLSIASKEFEALLSKHSNDESKFQKFFEQNPCFVPGSRDEFDVAGQSGHNSHLDCLISQPKISGIINRIPDFMWLASDSMFFVPVIIEIESPSKKYFQKNGTLTSHFSQARHQLEEWHTILKRPENVLKFYEDFAIPQDLRELTFKPRFVLIYGRRSEFENNKILKQKRASLVGENQVIMSYDRIKPKLADNFVTCNVKNGKYIAKYLSPTFKISPDNDEMFEIENLINAVDNSNYISDQRKMFLKEKIPYCLDFFRIERSGIEVRINRGKDYQIEE